MNERVDGLIMKSFSICNCPLPLIKEFKTFCFEETKGDYSMGLKILLERNRLNYKEEVMALKVQELYNEVQSMKSKPEEGEKKVERKTFGKKVEVKKDEQVE